MTLMDGKGSQSSQGLQMFSMVYSIWKKCSELGYRRWNKTLQSILKKCFKKQRITVGKNTYKREIRKLMKKVNY